MYAIIARFQVKPNHADEVVALLNQAAIPSRQEPGCHLYIANQDLQDPDRIVMCELYEDEAAFQAHLASDHFRDVVAAKVIPLLESRVRETFAVETKG